MAGLVVFQDTLLFRKQTKLEDVTKKYRSVRFAWIEVTSKCHQHCLHCFLGRDLNATGYVPIEKIRRYIDVLVDAGVKQVVFSGGEPTLHPKIADILSYAAQYQIHVSLLTSGSTKQCLELASLFSEKHIMVKIPLLGWEDTHDKMTNLKGSFTRAMRTISKLMEVGAPIELGTTATQANIRDIPKIRQFVNEKGLRLEVSPVYKIGYAEENADLLINDDQKSIIAACKSDKLVTNKGSYTPKPPTRILPQPDPTDYEVVNLKDFLTTQHECGQKIVAILGNGNVTPCLLLREDCFCIGSTHTHDLAEILSPDFGGRKVFDEYMSLHHIPGCNQCEARYVCKAGGCPATSWAVRKTVHTRNPMYTKCYYTDTKTRSEAGLQSIVTTKTLENDQSV